MDQGFSAWPLPGRDAGLYRSFLALHAGGGGLAGGWHAGLRAEAARLLRDAVDPLDSACESLELLGVADAEWDAYLRAALLVLRGWGGMVREVELCGDRVALPAPAGSLGEFVAVRLLLDRLAAADSARGLGLTGSLAELRRGLRQLSPAAAAPTPTQRAFPLFQLAQLFGWSPDEMRRLTAAGWAALAGEVDGFTDLKRRRLFHLAYERRFRTQSLDAFALHAPQPTGTRPRMQVFTCLDEREESFRRHLEELAPDCETFGAAGFYGVAIYYRGAADAQFVPLCPIVLTPGHWVEEQSLDARPPPARGGPAGVRGGGGEFQRRQPLGRGGAHRRPRRAGGSAVVVLGLATAGFAAAAARVQTDIKSALSFAAVKQVGLIVAEIGLGWRYLPLLHLLGHACLRTVQFVRAPSVIRDHSGFEAARGGRLPRVSAGSGGGWGYRFAFERGHLDALLDGGVARPFVALFTRLDRLDRLAAQALAGGPTPPPAGGV